VYFVLYVFVLYFVLYLYYLALATRDRCGGRKRDGASCLGCTLGTWLCSMSNSIIHHVSCYRFVSQHTYRATTRKLRLIGSALYIYHIGPHAHVDTDSDSRQQPPAPAPTVAQIIQNNTKLSLLYYVLHVLIVLCIVLCIMYFRSLGTRTCRPATTSAARATCNARTRTRCCAHAAARARSAAAPLVCACACAEALAWCVVSCLCLLFFLACCCALPPFLFRTTTHLCYNTCERSPTCC
jgi:hypothetical protein